MKKKLAVLLSLTMAVSMLAVGCGNSEKPVETPATQTESPSTGDETPVAEGALKTGLAVVAAPSHYCVDAGDEDGLAQVDSTAVAVTVDADGKIVECVIDALQTKVNFDATGKITTDLGTEFQTKLELQDGYNMRGVSGIGKEWFEQAEAFGAYCVGKTAEEVRGIELNDAGAPVDADLAAGCTIHSVDFVEAVAKAAETATDMGAQAGDKLGLAVVSSIGSSKDASADGDGLAQGDAHIAATTVNADGVITSAILDALQGKVSFDATGKLTTDLATTYLTKNELKEDYNMKGVSGIGKEWYEQAAAFAQYCVGKTADEVTAIALTDAGAPSDADLAAGCTVHATDFVAVVAKAAANAK